MFPKFHPNTKSALKLIFATLLVAAGVVALASFAPDNEVARIAFSSYDGNDFEIFTANPDGSDLVQITDNDYDDWGATWSPDRQQLAFRSAPGDIAGIYLMNADGSNIRQVSAPQMTAGSPFYQGTMTWSPDGTHIAYAAYFTDNWDIWTTRFSDGHITRLTSNTGDDLHPDWSADGSQIAYNRYDNGLLEIYVMDADGSNVTRLTKSEGGMVMYPRWSPDGDEIVFFINEGDLADIFIMDADGSNVRQLTTDSAIDRVAVFSPDGKSIVFRSERDGDSDIYTMNIASGEISAVSINNILDMAPDW